MTIAAGLMCSDGLVMCADSQELVGDYKWPVKKLAIPRVTTNKTRLIISGAGFGPAIDTATQSIFTGVSMEELSYEQTLSRIRSILRDIHEHDMPNHPLRGVADLDFKLLVAFQAFDGGGMFVTSGSLVTRVEHFEVIGSGEITKFFAHMMYRKTSWETPILKMSEGTVLAAYLIHLAKSQLNSIGGQSQIATLGHDGTVNLANEWEVPKWEQFFTEYQYHSSATMLHCADPMTSEEDFVTRLDDQVLALKAMKRSLVQKRAEWDEIWKQVTQSGGVLTGHTPTPSTSDNSED